VSSIGQLSLLDGITLSKTTLRHFSNQEQKRTRSDKKLRFFHSGHKDPQHEVAISNPLHYPGHNYAGPLTDMKNVQRHVKPVDSDDWYALEHDIAYSKAKDYKDIQKADDDMVQHIRNDTPYLTIPNHANLMSNLLQLKRPYNYVADKIGLTPTSDATDYSPDYQSIIKETFGT